MNSVAPEQAVGGISQPPSSVVEPYPEVTAVLDELRVRGVRLAVVSDGSPNLPDLHGGVGPSGYFEAYAISAVLGCTKPDPRMYLLAAAIDIGDQWPASAHAAAIIWARVQSSWGVNGSRSRSRTSFDGSFHHNYMPFCTLVEALDAVVRARRYV